MDEIHQKIQLFIQTGKADIPLSVNERSLQIFGNEKYLASPECQSILKKYHLSLGLFNVYQTPEPFIYYHSMFESKDALIIENKDTWYTMRKVLMETGSICGMRFSALIYGEGRKIQSSFSYIESEDTRDIHQIDQFYYFGDIDSSGIDILYKLIQLYPSYRIIPFEIGYDYLYTHQKQGRKKELKRDIKISMQELMVLQNLGIEKIKKIFDLCNQGYIIPQEVMNYEVLKNWDLFS